MKTFLLILYFSLPVTSEDISITSGLLISQVNLAECTKTKEKYELQISITPLPRNYYSDYYYMKCIQL